MAHGQPDYGMYGIASTIYRLADMGELAARLGSIVSFDRRGDVVWLESFEFGDSAWSYTLAGTNSDAAPSAEYARSGGFALKLVTGTGANPYVIAQHLNYRPITSKVGVELSFSFKTGFDRFHLTVNDYDGSDATVYSVEIDKDGTNLRIRTGLVTWITLESAFDLYADAGCFHIVKLVIDISTGKYVRLLINDQVWDISDYSGWESGSATLRNLGVVIHAYGDGDTSVDSYVDGVIITQNEP